jgi:VWFA-related protein
VLVYAIGIDGGGDSSSQPPRGRASTPPARIPVPSPFPGRRPPAVRPAPQAPRPRQAARSSTDSVDEDALRSITDDSGGRTEIVRDARDLAPAITGIADELSQQYFLGYSSPTPKDGRWHTIEVRLKRGGHHVRARKGYVAG